MARKPWLRSDSSDSKTPSGVDRRSVLLSGIAVGSGVLAGCAGGGGDGDDGSDVSGSGDGGDGGDGDDGDDGSDGSNINTEGTLYVGLDNTPIEFDPVALNDIPSAQVCAQVFSSLYRYDEGLGFVPDLAADDFEVVDDTTYRAELRDDAQFHNGDPVTTDDIIYSMTAPVDEETPNAPYFDGIDEFEVDGNTITFHLDAPDPVFTIYALMSNIVPKSVREEDPDGFITNPVGSGPFQFDSWNEGEYVRLQRWDGYWGDETPNLAEVEFQPIVEPTTRVTTLKTGSVDAIQGIPPELFQQVEDIDQASTRSTQGLGYYYVAFNCNEGPTADVRVREAVDYSFSMQQAVENFVKPAGQRAYAPLNRPIVEEWGFPEDEWAEIPHDEPDLDQAEQLLSEAGISPDNWEPLVIVPPDDMREQIGVSMMNGLEELGYNTQVQRLDWGTYLETYVTGNADDYNMYVLGSGGGPDPANLIPWFFDPEVQGQNAGNFYSNEQVAERVKAAGQTNDREERKEHYEFVIETILKDRVHLPAYTLENTWGVSSAVQDLSIHSSSHYNPRLHSSVSNTWVDR